MADYTIIYEHITSNITDNGEVFIPIPVLAKELRMYKISSNVLSYLVVPIALWGCLGNLLSFR